VDLCDGIGMWTRYENISPHTHTHTLMYFPCEATQI